MKTLEHIFERILWESRLMLLVAVVASLVGAVVLVAIGAYDVWLVIHDGLRGIATGDTNFKAYQIEAISCTPPSQPRDSVGSLRD